jgi:hypothetical protein
MINLKERYVEFGERILSPRILGIFYSCGRRGESSAARAGFIAFSNTLHGVRMFSSEKKDD